MPKPAAPTLPSADAENVPTSPTTPPPKFITTLGRGGHGKSFLMRWAVERAQQQGRSVVVADADRTNATLTAFFGDSVLTPTFSDDDDMRDWLTTLIEQQIEDRFTAALDLGGGDLLLKRLARETPLTELLEKHGVQVVAVHVIGPDRDDLAYLRDMEEGKLFAPASTILVLNEGLLPKGRSSQAAFLPVIEDAIFMAAIDRGAVPVWMPRLLPAYEVDERRLAFADAEASKVKEGQKPIGIFNRQLIATWRSSMEEAFAPVATWLP